MIPLLLLGLVLGQLSAPVLVLRLIQLFQLFLRPYGATPLYVRTEGVSAVDSTQAVNLAIPRRASEIGILRLRPFLHIFLFYSCRSLYRML